MGCRLLGIGLNEPDSEEILEEPADLVEEVDGGDEGRGFGVELLVVFGLLGGAGEDEGEDGDEAGDGEQDLE